MLVGLVSDTHIPDRWRDIPEAVLDALTGVDIILHAGDVGDLAVLDQLGSIAPVIAVHGNDEVVPGATRELPFQQLIHSAGHRILLTHSHYPDRAEEMRFRQINEWEPKLARLAGFARRAGASIVVYGHTHIPMAVEFESVWLVNPGAIAGGNYFHRQRIQSVARLTLRPGQSPEVEHVIINSSNSHQLPPLDLHAGFMAAFHQFGESIITPQLQAESPWLHEHVLPLGREQLFAIMQRLMYRVLDGELTHYGIEDVQTELMHDPAIPDKVKALIASRYG